MKPRFNMSYIQHALGLAPATAERVEGLLSGRINPDHFRSIDGPPVLDTQGLLQHDKILRCVASLLNAKGVGELGDALTFGRQTSTVKFVDRGDDAVPTVILIDGAYLMEPVQEFVRKQKVV